VPALVDLDPCPPKVKKQEIEILTQDQIALVTDKLVGHPLYEIAAG